jgi:formate hydrogenlyase subunit 6/NADH:ubiquinone oxidoreductase subunit I
MARKTMKSKKKNRPAVASRKCAGCSYCKLNCPADAMVVEKAVARPTGACIACGACVWVCPVGAITLKETVHNPVKKGVTNRNQLDV